MKKFFVLSCAFLLGASFSLAQTPSTPITPAPSTVSASDPLIVIARNIDRRMAQFNRSVKTHDMEGLQGIVSGENKDFSANFLKFIGTAPVFSVKRDSEQGILKTPQDEYTFPALLSLGGKEAKVTMTFVEEDFETGNKWVIIDSNLHIIGKTLAPAQEKPSTPPAKGSLTSSALNTPPEQSTTSTPTQQKPVSLPENTPSSSVDIKTSPSEAPLASAATTAKPAPVKAPVIVSKPTVTEGLGTGTLVSIAVGITLLLGLAVGLYYFMRKRKGLGKALLAAQAVASLAIATDSASVPTTSQTETPVVPETISPSPEPVPEKPALEQMESNVSLVEAPSESGIDTISEPQNTETPPQSEETAPLSTEDLSSKSTPPEMAPVTEDIQTQIETQDISLLQDTSPAQPTETLPPSLPEETPVETISPEQPAEDISVLSENPEDAPSNNTPISAPLSTETPLSIPNDTTPSLGTEDPLFSAPHQEEAVLEPSGAIDPLFSSTPEVTSPEPDSLFASILSPKPEPTDSSSLFGNL